MRLLESRILEVIIIIMQEIHKQKKLIDVVQRLEKAELVRYATNIGMEVDESMDVKELREAYAKHILTHPKELLIRLPKNDLDIIERARKAKSSADVYTLDLHLTPLMVRYGLADAETPYEDAIGIDMPEDLCEAFFPHIRWALNDSNNQLRMSVEIAVEGLVNVIGIADRKEIIDLLKVLSGNDNEENAHGLLNTARQFSLLLDSLEWAENLTTAADEDLLFVSRFGWQDTAKMKKYIETRSKDITETPDFDVADIALASSALVPVIPNERGKDFMRFLMTDLGFDQVRAYLICFNLWYFKTRRGEYDENDENDAPLELYFLSNVLGAMKNEPTDEQAEEAMRRMADYVDHLPLWHLAGHTAAEYPSEAFVPKLSNKEPLGPVIRKIRKEARIVTDILNGEGRRQNLLEDNERVKAIDKTPWFGGPMQPYVAPKKVGRNDLCPCGSGKKYKNCCGRGN